MQCGKIKQGKEIEGVGSGCYFKEDSQNLLTAAVISGKEKTVRVSYEVEVFQTEGTAGAKAQDGVKNDVLQIQQEVL